MFAQSLVVQACVCATEFELRKRISVSLALDCGSRGNILRLVRTTFVIVSSEHNQIKRRYCMYVG